MSRVVAFWRFCHPLADARGDDNGRRTGKRVAMRFQISKSEQASRPVYGEKADAAGRDRDVEQNT